ncbi:hypothetical protein [Micropruina sp.]|uniref:hypothetical protein n=1 Tax=Micropruina sp. TaxID=2737536 RepID=UPI0039E2855A
MLVFPELAPGRAITLPSSTQTQPRCLALLGDDLVTIDQVTGEATRWIAAAATWVPQPWAAFAAPSAAATGSDGLLLVADASGLWQITLNGDRRLLRAASAGERTIGVGVAGDGRIAVTTNPAGVLVSADGGQNWTPLDTPAQRPGAIAGLPDGFAVVDANDRAVHLVRDARPPASIGAAEGVIAPLAVAAAFDGVVVADAVSGRVRRYAVVGDTVIPAEFVDAQPLPTAPPLFQRPVALAAPIPTGA